MPVYPKRPNSPASVSPPMTVDTQPGSARLEANVQIDERCIVILGGGRLQPDMICTLAAETDTPDWIVRGSRVENRTLRLASPRYAGGPLTEVRLQAPAAQQAAAVPRLGK